jgi:acetyl/propionyl-CoA carboxylase alpha subunit
MIQWLQSWLQRHNLVKRQLVRWRALDEFVIEGIKQPFLFTDKLMDDPRYIKGDYTTAFMDTKMNDPE